MRILVAGASGFIGTALRRELEADGHEVRALVRRPARDATEYEWQPAEGRIPIVAVEWADGVVNLSGAYLGRVPWTRAYRDRKSTRLNSSHVKISYAVFCLKKKNAYGEDAADV